MNETKACTSHPHKWFGILIIALAIAVGNIVGGWYIAKGLFRIKMDDRYVSVKGIAERGVKSDMAIWNITYSEAGNDLPEVNKKAINDQKIITAFLTSHGFTPEEIDAGQTTVIDQYANEYRQGNKPDPRFIINNALQVRSSKVDLIKQTSKLTADLVAQGIALTSKEYTPNPRYLYTKLDSIRPSMLEEATKSARLAAEQFAINSNSKLGKIKHASQGVFQFLSTDTSNQQNSTPDSDQENSLNKTVRVVSTIDYFLEQ